MTLPHLRLRASLPAKLSFAVCLLALFTVQRASAQSPEQPVPKKTFTPGMDVSVGAFGQLTDTRTPTTTTDLTTGVFTTEMTQGPSQSAGVLGTFHESFKPWLGYNVNFGYSQFSENYSAGDSFVPNATTTAPASAHFAQGSIRTNMYELTIASVIEGPRTKRFSTFAQFGGGGLFFLPTAGTSGAKDQTRPAMLFGVGMNYKISSHLDMRAEYRGLFYKSPDFNLPPYDGFDFPMSRLFTVTSEPTISLVYRFGGTKKAVKDAPHRD